MRLLPLIFMLLAGSLFAGEPTVYPLWDGSESVADYAKKVNLPATKTLDLGNGVKLELVLIPAGKFIMGTPEPTPLTPVDENGFQKKIITGEVLLAISAAALLVMVVVVVVQAVRKKRRPQISLALLLLVTVAVGGCVLSAFHWRQSVRGLEAARLRYQAAQARYDAATPEEKPAHPVTLTHPFYMGKFAVTQAQYEQVIGRNPSHFIGKDNPIETVTWHDAQEFCKKLIEQTKDTIRLPTEAEWEYSCRAGTRTTYYSGDEDRDLSRVGWSAENSKATHPVGQKEPNVFGLYDMHGNVWQWCQDCYADDYYSKSPTEDPTGSVKGTSRAIRGGDWLDYPLYCRTAYRRGIDPNDHGHEVGFRVVSPAPK